jgi:hypothetical protein
LFQGCLLVSAGGYLPKALILLLVFSIDCLCELACGRQVGTTKQSPDLISIEFEIAALAMTKRPKHIFYNLECSTPFYSPASGGYWVAKEN